jgi:hypothetical protein
MDTVLHRGRVSLIAFCIVLLCLAGLVGRLSRAPGKDHLVVQDRVYNFTLAAVTRGTNHEVFSGNVPLAKLKKAVRQSPLGVYPTFRVLPHAEWYVRPVARAITNVVWLGWIVPGSSQLSTPVEPPDPTESNLQAEFVEPDGRSRALELASLSFMPRAKEFLAGWVLPDTPTNFSGCAVRLRTHDRKLIAILNLE